MSNINEQLAKAAYFAGATHHKLHGDEWFEMDNDAILDFSQAIARNCADIASEYASCEGIAQKIAADIKTRYELK